MNTLDMDCVENGGSMKRACWWPMPQLSSRVAMFMSPRHARNWLHIVPRAMLVAATLFATMASAQAADFPISTFSASNELASWGLITDKWTDGDSTIAVDIAKIDKVDTMHIRSKLGRKFAYPFTGTRRLLKTGGVPVDMSAYKGVRLRVRGSADFKLQILTAAVVDFNEFVATVPVEKNWRTVDLPFVVFAQSPFWGAKVKWNSAALRGAVLYFDGLPGAPEVNVDISSIAFYK